MGPGYRLKFDKYLTNQVKEKSVAGTTDGTGCPRKEQDVEDKVISIVSEQLSVNKDEITRESNFIDDLHADSMDLVELGMKFEEEFGVTIPDEDYEKLRTVGDAIDYIKQKENA